MINNRMIHYTVYKVTNKISGKFYIGTHKTKNLNDGYMGSGKYLNRAIEKHGLQNFEKEILFVFDNPDEMYAKEAEIVNEDFLAEENTYNLRLGGFGGWDYVNSTGKNIYGENGKRSQQYLKNGREIKEKMISEGRWEEHCRRRSIQLKKAYADGHRVPAFKNKKHTEEAKRKISEASSSHQAGEKNSQFGVRWIYSVSLRISKKISKNDPIPEGWELGRVTDFDSFERKLTKKHRKKRKTCKTTRSRGTTEKQQNKTKQNNSAMARHWYELLMSSGAVSIRDFVRNSSYTNSHVAFIKMLKTHIPEFQPKHGKPFNPNGL